MTKNPNLYDVIAFKDEDEIDGEPVGPVVGYTQAELDESKRTGQIGVPYDPDRFQRWVTRSQAIALAQEVGADFRES